LRTIPARSRQHLIQLSEDGSPKQALVLFTYSHYGKSKIVKRGACHGLGQLEERL
jgi:hypothetical protein